MQADEIHSTPSWHSTPENTASCTDVVFGWQPAANEALWGPLGLAPDAGPGWLHQTLNISGIHTWLFSPQPERNNTPVILMAAGLGAQVSGCLHWVGEGAAVRNSDFSGPARG